MAKKLKSTRDRGLQQRIVFLTDKDQQAWLQQHSRDTHEPMGTVLRRAVDAYRQTVERKAARKPSRLMEHSADLKPTDDPLTF
jgi:hypothetical protein